jgi:D-alanyl-D-alanine carboxypeptidase
MGKFAFLLPFAMLIPATKGFGMPPIEAARRNLSQLSPAEKGPGYQYCLVDGGQIHCLEEGIADLRSRTPVTRKTTFNAFSVTKPFTATAVMRLVEKGRMDLRHPIGRYVDALPYKPEPDMGQLLSHKAGLPNPMPMNWVHPAGEHGGFDEEEFLDSLIASHPRLRRLPGERFAYSNLGYLLAGKAIEKAAGERYAEHIESDLIARLELGPEDYLGFTVPADGRHALGSIRRWSPAGLLLPFLSQMNGLRDVSVDGRIQLKAFQVNGSAYGGLIGNAGGFAVFLRALMPGGLLTDAGLERMWTVQGDSQGATPMALGWFAGRLRDPHSSDASGIPYFAHAGGGGGYYCEIRIYPGADRASVFMSNRTGIKDERLLDKIDAGTGL